MKKSRKVLLISSLGLLSTTAVVAPTTAILTSEKTMNNQSTNTSFFSTYQSNNEVANSTNKTTNITDLINLIKKIYEFIQKFKDTIKEKIGEITFNKQEHSLDINLNITSTSILNHLTAQKIEDIDLDKFLKLAQTILIQMNIIAPDSPRFLTFKNLNVNNEQTSATYELIVNWPNTTSQQPYTVKLTLNNLYPPQLQSQTAISTEQIQDGNALAWMLGGILGGIAAIVLVAVLIYILFRKTRWEIENKR